MNLQGSTTDGVRRPRRLQGIRVILAEDDPDTREVISLLLEQAGACVRAVATAAAALEQFQAGGCDIVITDYALAGGTGAELLEQIRAQPVDRHVPVIGYSAYAEYVSQREQAAFTVYVPKPGILIELVDTVRRAVA